MAIPQKIDRILGEWREDDSLTNGISGSLTNNYIPIANGTNSITDSTINLSSSTFYTGSSKIWKTDLLQIGASAPTSFSPAKIDVDINTAGKTALGLQIKATNQNTGITAGVQGLDVEIIPYAANGINQGINVSYDVTNLTSAILGTAYSYDGVYNGNNVTAADGISISLEGTGVTKPTNLIAATFTAFGASGSNCALRTEQGDIIFNESGNDWDLRVESLNNTHMFFLEGGTDRIGINNSTPSSTLDVTGTITQTGFKLSTGATNNYVLTSDGSGNGTWQASGVITDHSLLTNLNWSASGHTIDTNIVMADNSITGIDTLTFTDVNGTIAGIENQNLLDKTADESISGKYTMTTPLDNSGDIMLNLTPSDVELGTSMMDQGIMTGIKIDIDTSVSTNTVGFAKGIDIIMDNTGGTSTRFGTAGAIIIDYDDVYDHPWAALNISSASISGTPSSVDQQSILVNQGVDNTSTSIQGGALASEFNSNNSSNTGDVKAYSGYAQFTGVSPAGNMYVIVSQIGPTGGTANNYSYWCAPASPSTTRHYAFASNGNLLHAFRGQTWIANTNDLVSSNPATHLTVNAGSFDLFIEEDLEVDGTAYFDGDIDHNGTNIGFFGTAPVAQAAAYTPTNVTTDRSYDANATSTAELADVLGTLISDLQAYGLLQ